MVARSVAGRSRTLLYAIGSDPVVTSAVAAELGDVTVRRVPACDDPLTPTALEPPTLVLIGPDAPRPDLERQAAHQRWGGRTLVVEVMPGRPLALVWLGAECVRVVDLAPGFLAPFLAAQLVSPAAPGRWQPVRGWERLAHAGAALLIVMALTGAALGGWRSRLAQPPAEDLITLVTLEGGPAHDPFIAEPACSESNPC